MKSLFNLLKEKLNGRRRRRFVIVAIIALASGLCFYYAAVPEVLAQSAIGSLVDVVAPANGQRVLVFSPHPDDGTIGVGGYIAQSIKNGADVRIVLVTNGNYHHQETIRYTEFKKATAILGVPETSLVFLNFPDASLRKINQTILEAALRAQIDQFHPDIIIYPHPQDYNPDHAAIGKVVTAILESGQYNVTAYEYLVHYQLIWPQPRKFAPDLHLLPPENLIGPGNQWMEFTLTPAVEKQKEAAIFTYQSQLHNRWLRGLLLSSIRNNELLAIPKISSGSRPSTPATEHLPAPG
jgi:LmbE family N-acetylglucosaminyl deacetylase